MSAFAKQAISAIRQSGGRMTGQRQAIIRLLEQAQGQLDAEALYERARAWDANISIATVYRTLNVLEEAGLVRQRYQSPDHERKYYELARNEAEYYFTCRGCQRVVPFQSALIGQLKDQLTRDLGLNVASICVCVDGLCPDCRDESTPPVPSGQKQEKRGVQASVQHT